MTDPQLPLLTYHQLDPSQAAWNWTLGSGCAGNGDGARYRSSWEAYASMVGRGARECSAQIPTRKAEPDFNVERSTLLEIEEDWNIRYKASHATILRGTRDVQPIVTNENDLEFIRGVFESLQHHGGLGHDGNGIDELSALALGGPFPRPPPARFKGDWQGDGLFLCLDEDLVHYEWLVFCGPCQGLVEADRPCCGF